MSGADKRDERKPGSAGASRSRPGRNRPPRPRSDTTGVLVVDKPEGSSSMRAVAIVRRRAGNARTGHAGTLDPLATGVLVLALGRATRLIERFMATDKRYRTVINLAAFTAGGDRESPPEPVDVAVPPTAARITEALTGFTGRIEQRPPLFSAVKVDGKRAYELARAGADIELPARPVVIHAIDLLDYTWPHVELDVHTAKGVYIRSLARDLGLALGTGGYCESIRRTAVGPFDLDGAVALDDVPDPLTSADLIAPDDALAMLEPPDGA